MLACTRLPSLFLLLAACATGKETGASDEDGDGFTATEGDCDDLNAALHPGAPETCDGLDDDCDGTADNGPGMRCALGTGSPCGPCGLGRQSCTETCTWSACVSPEDACEPGAREDCVPEGCATGFRECVPGCVWGECVPYHTDCTAGMTRNCSVDRCGDGRQTCGDDCTWGGCAVACSPSRYTCCPGVGCVDLNWNDDHCGTCDTNCELFSVCLDGHCT
jgi:hypothetical protein